MLKIAFKKNQLKMSLNIFIVKITKSTFFLLLTKMFKFYKLKNEKKSKKTFFCKTHQK